MPPAHRPGSPLVAHRASPAELKAQLEALRANAPFLVLRDGDDRQRIVVLDGGAAGRRTIGRLEASDIALPWDGEVSRLHAELERVGGEWCVIDDGLSSNGTFVNGARVAGRRRLHDLDAVKVGATVLVFRSPDAGDDATTLAPPAVAAAPALTDAQRRVLAALCRPVRAGDGFATTATNQEIADELVISVEAVKSTLRLLFEKFGLKDLSQHQKRAALAEAAFRAGLASPG